MDDAASRPYSSECKPCTHDPLGSKVACNHAAKGVGVDHTTTSGASWRTKRAGAHLRKTESLALPTLPDGTDVKNGEAPSIWAPPSCEDDGCRKASASAAVANCGMRVSNLVDTTTVRDSVGSTCVHKHQFRFCRRGPDLRRGCTTRALRGSVHQAASVLRVGGRGVQT